MSYLYRRSGRNASPSPIRPGEGVRLQLKMSKQTSRTAVVHLELHTGNLARAFAFHREPFGWRAETIHAGGGSCQALELAVRVGGGAVECDTGHRVWLPYVEVTDISEATEHARLVEASVTLDARVGPAGWRGVLDVPAGGEIALRQPKTRAIRPPTKRTR
jgi:predicted enzyme related to lactoylglutathione lyase